MFATKRAALFLIIIALVFGACSSQTQDYVSLEGNLDGLQKEAIKITYQNEGTRTVDSLQVSDGKFSFSDTLTHPTRALLWVGDQRAIRVYMENSDITVKGNIDSLSNVKIEGSNVHKDYERHRESRPEFSENSHQIRKKLSKAEEQGNIEKQEALAAKLDSINTVLNEYNREFVRNNPDSFFSLQLIDRMTESTEYDVLKPLYANLSEEIKNSYLGQEIGETIENVAIGAEAPGFTLPNMKGESVSLSDYRGQYVLVDFWASWCKPCRAEHPHYVEAYENFKDENFTILSVSVDESKEDWKKAIEEDNLTWTQVCDTDGLRESDIAEMYEVRGIPMNFLLNPQGKIVAKDLRGNELERKLRKVFL